MFTILGADGKEYGPVTADKVHEWIKAGRANAHTSIKRAGETQWTTIAALPEFGGGPPAVPPLAAGPTAADASAPAPALVTAASGPAGTEPASRWLRLGSAILDSIISSFFLLPGLGSLFVAGIFNKPHQPTTPFIIIGICAFAFGALILLGIQIYLLSTAGQTMGKKLLGLRIVNYADGTNPGFVKAFLLRSFVNGLIGCVPIVGPLYSLVDLCFIFGAERRCIHDLIAGTVVVKV
jgi:uncharacterized RDD family membrane protein YckC